MLNLSALKGAWVEGKPNGQCAITALLVQDFLGGEILRAVMPSGSHYWNLLPGVGEIDLTRAQFDADQGIPRGEVVPRERLLTGERALQARTGERYQKLLEAYLDAL